MATPEGQDERRTETHGLELPELPCSERLADIWECMGRARAGGYGAVPFDFSDIDAFNRVTDCNLSPDEALCLVDMSRAYCVEAQDKNPLRKAPMERE